MKMKEKEDVEKNEFQWCKCRAYGLNGVGKQTNSNHDSKKRSIITKMADGKGIGRRVLFLFRIMKLFPSVGTKVVKHYITVGVHR